MAAGVRRFSMSMIRVSTTGVCGRMSSKMHNQVVSALGWNAFEVQNEGVEQRQIKGSYQGVHIDKEAFVNTEFWYCGAGRSRYHDLHGV